MDIQNLKDTIASLDPVTHRALREALVAKYSQLTGGQAVQVNECLPDRLDGLFQAACERISRQFPEGVFDYIRVNEPDLYRKTDDADAKLNAVWMSANESRASIGEFQAVLDEWSDVYSRAAEVFRAAARERRPDKKGNMT